MERKLAIFDIDGTLCDTTDVDAECFLRAAALMLGDEVRGYDWRSSPHVTDSGIIGWMWRERRGRPPTHGEVGAFRSNFLSELESELNRSPDRFREIPGAKNAVGSLPPSGWDVAIGTGGWTCSARLKLEAARLPPDLLLSSSDDSHDRVEIFSLAWRRSSERRGVGYDRVVLVGDGAWDVRVASEMRWPFLGIGHGSRSRGLIESGASSVLDDFTSISLFREALESCEVPGPRRAACRD